MTLALGSDPDIVITQIPNTTLSTSEIKLKPALVLFHFDVGFIWDVG